MSPAVLAALLDFRRGMAFVGSDGTTIFGSWPNNGGNLLGLFLDCQRWQRNALMDMGIW